MRNTRTYDQNLVIVDNDAARSYTFQSCYSQTRSLESGPLEHSKTILEESVPINKGEVEPVRLSDGDIEDFMESHPNLNELTRDLMSLLEKD